jgi:ABC-type multidrug transport system ATPase subunit
MLIVYTIHQPSFDIGNLFDRLLILNKGKVSFFDERTELEGYFEKLGMGCPDDMNPLDHAIDVVLTQGDSTDQKFF